MKYIENIKDIVKLAYARGVDMSTALAMYVAEGGGGLAPEDEKAAEAEYFAFVKGRKFDEDGNIVE